MPAISYKKNFYSMMTGEMTTQQFHNVILRWYSKNRRDLPWRNTDDPYKILVSEVMLQQTQVSRVVLKYHEFLKAFPDIETLARASDRKLFKIWAGLGYWRRARFLKETAQKIAKERNGKFPQDPVILDALPGVGEYTARALACFAFGRCEAFLDTNIRRVYLHFFFRKQKDVQDEEILKIARKTMWRKNPREWHYALFDYGATVLKDKRINRRSRAYHKQSRFEGSFRSFRTKAVRFLLDHPKQGVQGRTLRTFLDQELAKENSPHRAEAIISALLKDGTIKKSGKFYFI